MEYFVKEDHIVRKIWGKSDTILMIFAGSAAEFALNKAVDWLYFTGNLPADPLGRLFSTVNYAQKIVFATQDDALKAIQHITAIHRGVEQRRNANIPDWAYRDVLFMLIDYSIRAYELLERKLSREEKTAVFKVFIKLGALMELKDLPYSYTDWLLMREVHLEEDLIRSKFTDDLYRQYKKNLGPVRFSLLKQVQIMLIPQRVNNLLELGVHSYLKPFLKTYQWAKYFKFDKYIKKLLLPQAYQVQISRLDC